MRKSYLTKRSSGILKTFKVITLFLFVVFGSNFVSGQGANCGAAVAVNVNQLYTTGFSVSDTTVNDPVTATCNGQSPLRDGWFSFVATGPDARIIVTTGARNTIIYAYSGPCGVNGAGLTFLGCANAITTTGGQTETLTLGGLTAGATYLVRVANSTGNNMPLTGFIILTNDSCSGAQTLTSNTTCVTTTGSTTAATDNNETGDCTTGVENAVWFQFQAVATTHVVTVDGIAGFDAVLNVISACGSATAPSGATCVDNTGGNGIETLTLTGLTVGAFYKIQVHEFDGDLTANGFTICVTHTIPPVNNECANATALPCGTTNLAGTTVGTSSYNHGSSCTMSNYGVWYTFVGNGTVSTVSATSTGFNLEMSISSGSCGSLNSIACRDTAGANGTETYSFYTVTGLTYYIYIAHTNNGTNTGSFTISRTCAAPTVANDECSGAISLTPSTTCTYTNYTNVNSSASTGMTSPTCAEFSGRDVWFSVLVPATGQITIDMQTGTLTDSGLAFYTGNCGSLALLDCDDDGSTNGAMSSITRGGLTPGTTIYLRVWGYEGATGTFGICVTTPSCPSPSDLYADILSATSVTVNWSASTPPASGGYQYFINTTGTAPVAGSTPTGTTPPGVNSVTFTSLTSGQKYYFWVRSFCGGTDVSTWFGPTNYTPCAIGDGTGVTTLGCVTPITGGQGAGGNDPNPVSCIGSTCTNLEVSYLPIKQTTDYMVESITYNPPYQFTCLRTPVSVNIDDRWSPVINLPFNFCFYGNNYSSCLMGSNGVLTFNTSGAKYTPTGFSDWQLNNNLPNPNLFLNTIFGVYHDIDPSKGGEVGWELITLNSGCRALVAAWNEIPMYSAACNSSYYTGMIVLYENTNVIEVYIKEKNVCGTWNGGNAVVGLQNNTGSAAVTAPGRNTLDTNWTVTNEAWRFTPNGPDINPLVNWYQGNPTTGTLIASGVDTVNVCPTSTTTYTAQVTYPLCTGNLVLTDPTTVTVTNTKIWNGSAGLDWNTDANWTPIGKPTSTNCVIVPVVGNGRYPTIYGAPDGVGYSLLVRDNAHLTMDTNTNLTITDQVTVQTAGSFILNNSASLVQVNNVTNSGSITYNRISPNIRTLDYVYWSSPVANFNISNIVAPHAFGPIYHWNTTVPNANGGQGTWQNFSGPMVAGKGYIARSPGTAPFNNSTTNPLNGTFTGVPNNGNITIAIERGNDQNMSYHVGTNGVEISYLSDNWNLLGNPYPSALRGSQFLFDNRTEILGNIRLWTHGNLPVYTTNPFYNSFAYNYTSGDYLTYNFTGTSCCPTASDDLFIGAGQGFFVQKIDGPQVLAAANETVLFNNNQRSVAFSNNIFYKSANPTTTTSNLNVDTIERNRIWLDLINPNGQSDRTLFGYIEGATMDNDSFFDCVTQNAGGTLIFSEVNDTKFLIQGRSLPFDVNDEVAIGINAPSIGEFTIAIAAVDGLFDSQNIYLKDNLLNVTHNLKMNPYHFTTQSGGISGRFKIVYTDNTLGTPTQSFDNAVKVITNDEVAVSSSNLQMESIVVYNILGQKLDTYENVNSNFLILSNLRKNNEALLLKIKLQTGEIITKKVVH